MKIENKTDALSVRYIAKNDFTSLTGKFFKKGESVSNGDATSMMKHLTVLRGDETFTVQESVPEENKVMTKKDLKTK